MLFSKNCKELTDLGRETAAAMFFDVRIAVVKAQEMAPYMRCMLEARAVNRLHGLEGSTWGLHLIPQEVQEIFRRFRGIYFSIFFNIFHIWIYICRSPIDHGSPSLNRIQAIPCLRWATKPCIMRDIERTSWRISSAVCSWAIQAAVGLV